MLSFIEVGVIHVLCIEKRTNQHCNVTGPKTGKRGVKGAEEYKYEQIKVEIIKLFDFGRTCLALLPSIKSSNFGLKNLELSS